MVAIDYGKGNVMYYTSMNHAASKLAIAPASVRWAIDHGNVLTDVEGKVFTIGVIDGSEVPYKYINN